MTDNSQKKKKIQMLEDSFKSLSLGNSPVKQRLNRSMSEPDISPSKRLTFQEHIDVLFPKHAVVRREISCEELGVDPKTSSLKLFRRVVSELYVNYSSPDSIALNTALDINRTEPKPAELNMSSLSSKTSSSSSPRRKRRHLSISSSIFRGLKRQKLLQPSVSVNDSSKYGSEVKNGTALYNLICSYFIYSLVAIISIYVGLFAYQTARVYSVCNVNFNLSLVESVLQQKVFGQDESMQKLLGSLKDLYSKDRSGMKTFVFTGATGVGKTYTASVLEEVFPWPHNVHHYFMPFDTFESEKPFLSLPTCGDHLLIIDDLKEEEIKMAIRVADFVNTAYADQRRIIVIYIFKFHQQLLGKVSDENIIDKGLSVVANLTEKGLVGELIHFQTLQEKDVIKCIQHSLTNNWIAVKDDYVKMILEQVDYKKEGCKRISSKIAVLHELWARGA